MPRRDSELQELRHALRVVLRGLWRRRRPPVELARFLDRPGRPPIGPRHIALLVQVATDHEPRTIGELARELALSLPAASKLARDLEEHDLVHRREAIEDKRRTVVHTNAQSAKEVEDWIARRDRPLRAALAALTEEERAAFLKGLRTLGDELMKESACGPVRPHDRAPHRRRPDRDRSV
jgi:DNA-binding MarR family transcriptional regulator